MKYICLFLTLFLSFQTSIILAQQTLTNTISFDKDKGSPNASLSDISWLAGHWKGKMGEDETVEEIWTPPLAGSMMGVFKWITKGEVVFYEILTLTEKDHTLLLQLKHFGKDLKGWETKEETVDFKLVKVTPNKVYFDQFTFEKISDEEINLYVVFKEQSSLTEHKFNYHKVSHQNTKTPSSTRWNTVLKTSKTGAVIAGSKKNLVNAIRQGKSIKIAWGSQGKTHTIEHVAEPIWVAIMDDQEVNAYLHPQVLGSADWNNLTANYSNPAKLREEWRVVITTKGAFDAIWYDRANHERIKRVPQNHPITWMVEGPLDHSITTLPLYKQ